ncbi:MAG TPA: outer membrane lipoprotein-sorting protein [Verrucomicrobiae bacterium]|nr:outer membrane lipoprotein-sorting protein [Verrucomicrobiae bacterium]
MKFFPVIAVILFSTFGAAAQMTNDLSGAEIQGRQLAQKILEQWPAEDSTNTGVLEIHNSQIREKVPLTCETVVTSTNWQSIYTASWTNKVEILLVVHATGQSNTYFYGTNDLNKVPLLDDIPILGHLFRSSQKLSGAKLTVPFANSDFWFCDLGLEFFHWPEQKILKKELHRSRGCAVLESTNPHPAPNGYSRVVSWIDEETLGIVEAYAYDARGKLLKDFEPKDFKKIHGQWQMQTLVMENVQTGSRSRMEFDLKEK